MDHVDEGVNDDVFVYMGGDQEVPEDVTHVRIHKSVKIIRARAFFNCRLVSVEMHDGVEIIEAGAFYDCSSLRRINLAGVRVIGDRAFDDCTALESVEFGDKLETIGNAAFACTNLTTIKLSKFRVIKVCAFANCEQLMEVELSKDLKTIGEDSLKAGMFDDGVFDGCDALSRVDLVGGIHKTISSLLLESWRLEMTDEIDRINQVLPNSPTDEKTEAIRRWMERVLRRIEHFKSEHYALLKENMTQLELALWKSGLSNIDAAAGRHEARVTCGANIIIPHVLSFLNDEEVFPTVRDIPL
jgi:hypothetical protein